MTQAPVPQSASGMALLLALVMPVSGCYQRIAVDRFPPGVLQVRYVRAASYTDCLVAAAVMCASYVTASDRFAAATMRGDLEAAALDPARIADVKAWLAQRDLTLQPLTGSFSDKELTGLGWWLCRGGYPVTCVINKFAGNADYNHAVVVIGIDGGGGIESAQGVYYLDPASPRGLERLDRLTFLHYWGSAGNMMLPLFETPRAPRSTTPMPTSNMMLPPFETPRGQEHPAAHAARQGTGR